MTLKIVLLGETLLANLTNMFSLNLTFWEIIFNIDTTRIVLCHRLTLRIHFIIKNQFESCRFLRSVIPQLRLRILDNDHLRLRHLRSRSPSERTGTGWRDQVSVAPDNLSDGEADWSSTTGDDDNKLLMVSMTAAGGLLL